jgi:hypothetical protein
MDLRSARLGVGCVEEESTHLLYVAKGIQGIQWGLSKQPQVVKKECTTVTQLPKIDKHEQI